MIYIDAMNASFGRMVMCHMISDESEEELHAFAEKIGMKRAWFQAKSFPHYDVSKSRKAEALKLGAKEIDRNGLVEAMNRYREKNKCG